MINSKKTFILGGIAFFLAPFWLPSILSILGWYVNTPAWEAAQMIVEDGKDVNACKRIIIMPWRVFSPSTADQRIDCVGEYAALTKDPTACEKLMPSSLGLSCVGGAKESFLCFLGNDNTIRGNGLDVDLRLCISGPEDIRGNPCCKIAIISSVYSENDCSSLFSTQHFYDECLYRLSFKNHDATTCILINDDNIRTACTISARALKENPSICEGCAKPVENIEELLK